MTVILEVDTSAYPVYDSKDLLYFQHIVEDALDEIGNRADAPRGRDGELKVRLAANLFEFAADGDRDYLRLKQLIIETVAPERDPGPAAVS